jgi:hypothetical protein
MAEYDKVGGGGTGAATGALSGAAAGAAFGPIGMIGGAILGGIFGSKKTKVPKPPTYSQMMSGALTAQEGMQGRLIGLEREWRPEWQSINEDTMLSQLYGDSRNKGFLSIMEDLQGGVAGLERQAAMQNLGLVSELTPYARESMLSSTQKSMFGTLMQDAQSRGISGELNSDERRNAQQSARSAMAARGLTGRQAVAAEVLNMESAMAGREARNRANYMQAFQLETGMQDAATKMALSGLSSATARGQLIGAAGSVGGAQPQIFQPESAMAAQAAGVQYQHGMGLAQSKMAQQQGLMQALGSFGSMAIQNPGMFNFSGSLGTPTMPPSPANVNPYAYASPIGPVQPPNMGYSQYGLTNSLFGNNMTTGGRSW